MKVLFDQNVPHRLRRHLTGHQVVASAELGWERTKDSALLDSAERHGFDVLVTADKNLSYQQNLRNRKIAIVVLPTTSWPRLLVIAPEIARHVNAAKPSTLTQLPLLTVRRR